MCLTSSNLVFARREPGAEAVAATLRAKGLAVEVAENRVRVGSGGDDGELADALRDAIADAGAPLRRMEPARQSLEDLFLDEVYGT